MSHRFRKQIKVTRSVAWGSNLHRKATNTNYETLYLNTRFPCSLCSFKIGDRGGKVKHQSVELFVPHQTA
jgi:deoxycytidylate deaminase